MRLLNTKTRKLEEFLGDPPEYAILSHTWLQGAEPTYQDIEAGTRTDTEGYRKIIACCDRAQQDEIEYIWVDTCCIDKTTNVNELPEAIISMFKWYKNSKICYAYLSDYDISHGSSLKEDVFRRCKWFTRGWTLQELIAPKNVVFYSRKWDHIGSKADNCKLLSSITRISTDVLEGKKDPLKDCSVAQRMSWGSERVTTRDEDIA
jgi:hypothetical protein